MTGILLYSLNALSNFCAAIIIVLKCATTLHASGLFVQPALSQAMSNYNKLNIGPKIVKHFTAPPCSDSSPDVVNFIMGVSVGLLLHAASG